LTVYRAGTHEILGDDEMRTDFGYRSRRDAVLHFGVAHVRSVDVRVTGAGLGSAVTVHHLKVDRVVTITMPPRAPIAEGRRARGAFTLTWAPLDSNPGFTYRLQEDAAADARHRTSEARVHVHEPPPREQGTWRYRVAASYKGTTSAPSPPSEPITVR
jgi:hypothetical protein